MRQLLGYALSLAMLAVPALAQDAADFDAAVATVLAEGFPFCDTGAPDMEEGLALRVAVEVMQADPGALSQSEAIAGASEAVQRQIATGALIADETGLRLANCPESTAQMTLRFAHQANELLLLEGPARAALLAGAYRAYGCTVPPDEARAFFRAAINHFAAAFDLTIPPAIPDSGIASVADFIEAVEIVEVRTRRAMIAQGRLMQAGDGTLRLTACAAP